MKILQVSTYFLPVIGGLENVVHNLSKALLRRGHQVDILTSDLSLTDRKIEKEEETIDGLQIYRTPCIKLRYGLELPLRMNDKLFKDYQIVHMHAHLSPFYLSTAYHARQAQTSVLSHFMALDGVRTHHNTGIRIFGTLFETSSLLAYKRLLDIALAKNQLDYGKLESHRFPTVGLLPDGCPKPNFQKQDKRLFRDRYGVSGNEIILFLGRLHPLKGIMALLRAAERVVKDQPDATFIIAGPDDGMGLQISHTIRTLGLEKNVKLTGYLSEKEKLSALSTCTMLVIPSLSDIVEVYSTVISEAFAQRKPVIASNIGGLPARIKDGYNGFLVQPNNYIQLAQKIKLLLSDRELANKMGERGYLQVHSWDEIAALAERIYHKSMKTPR